jgi:hypothetical protein
MRVALPALLCALAAPAAAQYVPPAPGTVPAERRVMAPARTDAGNPLCTFHGPACDAPPAAWEWQRLSPATAAFSVELPCDAGQAERFGEIIAMSRAKFPGKSTRACMKASSGFVATIVGFPGTAVDPAQQAELDVMLSGAPDLFSAFMAQTTASSVTPTTFKGRRAVGNIIEKPDRRTRVMIIEVGPYAVIMITADINPDFPGTREEADAAVERFIQSLEIAA